MKKNDITLEVHVKGRPVKEYNHEGQVFIEGRYNSEYELVVFNNTHNRVEGVISVDGISITDGKEAGPDSTGFLFPVGRTVIPGWMVDNSTAAKFQFGGKNESYAASESSNGNVKNTGVIGIMCFSEKPVYNNFRFYGVPRGIAPSSSGVYGSGSNIGSSISQNSVNPNWDGSTTCDMMYNSQAMSCNAQAETANREVKTSGGWRSKSINIAASAATANSISNATETAYMVNNLGTGFGQATDFKTTQVNFDRHEMIAMLVVFYDDAKGLKARGIDLRKIKETPDAFPGMSKFCKPVDGWKK